ncbi:hypothetical protein G9A89_005306 [Geosiphon pyriformis]|nr:hypothetical protein G9A89_005306 [Geosiphon pyriformis]
MENEKFLSPPKELYNDETFELSETNEKKLEYPTQIELDTLKRVSDDIPSAAWYNIAFCFCEAFAYSGVAFLFQNYIQFPVPDQPGQQSGALGKGQQMATSLTSFFLFWSWSTPIIAALIADRYMTKFNAMMLFSAIFVFGLIILTVTATPAAIKAGFAFPGVIIGMIVLGLGDGLQSTLYALVGEQYPHKKPFLRTLSTGEKVIVDPKITILSMYHWFYMILAIGYLAPVFTTSIEKYHSFWLAFLVATVVFLIGSVLLLRVRGCLLKTNTKGLELWKIMLVFRMAIGHGWKLEDTKPSNITANEYSSEKITWDDKFIDELRQACHACCVLLFQSFYWMAYFQMGTNLISQAATMETGFIPNDLMNIFDPIALCLLVPFANKIFLPFLRKHKIEPSPIMQMFIGFMLITAAMAYAAVLQVIIYNTPPCYQNTLCTINGIQVPNRISVWYQLPIYALVASSEVFLAITSLEYSFNQAPASMKGFIMAIYLFSSGIGSLLVYPFVPLAKDPLLPYLYGGMGVTNFLTGFALLIFYRTGINDRKNETLSIQDKLNQN